MEASPCSNVLTSSGKPSQKSGGCYSSKGGTNSILVPMILEWDVRQAGVHILLVMYCIYRMYNRTGLRVYRPINPSDVHRLSHLPQYYYMWLFPCVIHHSILLWCLIRVVNLSTEIALKINALPDGGIIFLIDWWWFFRSSNSTFCRSNRTQTL